jgi:hypothetical protein
MNKEIFKDILGYEGLYQVSNFGNVKSLGNDKTRKEKILKPIKNRDGYYKVILCKEGKVKTICVHVLVAQAFLGHIPDGTMKIIPDHKDTDKSNNNLSNLELITQRENIERYWLNKKKSSKYIGVSWCKKSNKWVAGIYVYNKRKNLGYFADEHQAHLAYQKALNELKHFI